MVYAVDPHVHMPKGIGTSTNLVLSGDSVICKATVGNVELTVIYKAV